MVRIIQSPEFRQDTDDAWDYYAEKDPDYAEAFIRKVADKLSMVGRFPQMGRARPALRPDVRSVLVGNYLIYYRVTEDGIEAVRLLHSARDVEGLF